MQFNDFGNTGLRVSALGLGAMHINDERVTEAAAGRLLNEVLDLGVNLIDTARGYGLSEERIGRHIAHRRQDYVLSTKVGYGIPGVADWTAACITQGVDAALTRLRCEQIDIVHLHSCPLAVLQQGEVIEALLSCQAAGKLGVAAYSGDNAELDFALNCEAVGALQTSISVCDQVNLAARLPLALARGIGVIAKRPLAGAVWRHAQRPDDYAEGIYWDRWQAMGLAAEDINAMALRFAAFAPGVSSCIVGTSKLAHFKQNLAALALGPLEAELQAKLRQAFLTQDVSGSWVGLI
jgi:aryl-alcohol dehydrogenase-like predicted oxidoreductase